LAKAQKKPPDGGFFLRSRKTQLTSSGLLQQPWLRPQQQMLRQAVSTTAGAGAAAGAGASSFLPQATKAAAAITAAKTSDLFILNIT